MASILETALSNTLAACCLALVAVLAARLQSRPALAHGLWLLVLLKLFTPPLVRVHFDLWPKAESAAAISVAAAPHEPEPDVTTVERAQGEPLPQPVPEPLDAVAPDALSSATAAATFDWPLVLLAISALGSVIVGVLLVMRTRRFAKLLRHSQSAPPALVAEVAMLCRRLGIERPPEVRLVPGCLPPMLWATFARAQILLPARLLARLSGAEITVLLAHELAHLRRRDHWVRHLELLARAVYWWNPLVWWAARELRHAEEECCDAWVVWALPHAPAAYAHALLKTVQFLAVAKGPVPVAATGMGPVQNLDRRLTMIMQSVTPRSLSRSGRVLVLAAAAAVLPTLPAFAQGEERAQREERETTQFLEQNREHPDQKMHEAAEKTMARAGLWLDEHAPSKGPQGQEPGKVDERIKALEKAIKALREQDDARSAKILALLADELRGERRQQEEMGAKWRNDNAVKQKEAYDRAVQYLEKAQGGDGQIKYQDAKRAFDQQVKQKDQAASRYWDLKSSLQKDPTRWEPKDGRETATLEDMVKLQDHRFEELAGQVARLSQIVDKLAAQVQESEAARKRDNVR